MKEPALTRHPETGEPVRRRFTPPNLGTRYTPGATASKLDNRSVEKAGFTKYERDKLTGTYHKVAGRNQAAPDTIRRPAD
jgi:transcriptional regulator NrdR family protein